VVEVGGTVEQFGNLAWALSRIGGCLKRPDLAHAGDTADQVERHPPQEPGIAGPLGRADVVPVPELFEMAIDFASQRDDSRFLPRRLRRRQNQYRPDKWNNSSPV